MSSNVVVNPAVIAPRAIIVAIPIPIPTIANNALLLLLKGFLNINDKNGNRIELDYDDISEDVDNKNILNDLQDVKPLSAVKHNIYHSINNLDIVI